MAMELVVPGNEVCTPCLAAYSDSKGLDGYTGVYFGILKKLSEYALSLLSKFTLEGLLAFIVQGIAFIVRNRSFLVTAEIFGNLGLKNICD